MTYFNARHGCDSKVSEEMFAYITARVGPIEPCSRPGLFTYSELDAIRFLNNDCNSHIRIYNKTAIFYGSILVFFQEEI